MSYSHTHTNTNIAQLLPHYIILAESAGNTSTEWAVGRYQWPYLILVILVKPWSLCEITHLRLVDSLVPGTYVAR